MTINKYLSKFIWSTLSIFYKDKSSVRKLNLIGHSGVDHTHARKFSANVLSAILPEKQTSSGLNRSFCWFQTLLAVAHNLIIEWTSGPAQRKDPTVDEPLGTLTALVHSHRNGLRWSGKACPDYLWNQIVHTLEASHLVPIRLLYNGNSSDRFTKNPYTHK